MSQKHHGSCHCGAVRFVVQVDLSTGASRCNCTICLKTGAVGRRVTPAEFELVSGKEALSSYEWGGRVSKRYFCKHCGVYCYGAGHLAILGGDFVSFNVSCLDDVDPNALKIGHFDGRHDNWMAGMRDQPWPIAASDTLASA